MAQRNSPFFDTATTLGRIVSFFGIAGLCGVLAAGLLVPGAMVAGNAATAGIEAFSNLPAELDESPLAEPSKVLDKDGNVLATFYAENRVPVTIDKISQNMKDAIISIEDERFYEHNGVDPRGIGRALINNLTSSSTQGASTLTQQYVNNVLINTDVENGVDRSKLTLSGNKNIQDKLREAKLAVAVENKYSKDEILAGYLNIVLFSGTTYGVEAAAQRFFSIPASKLNIQQSAMLAGMVQRPVAFNPLKNPELTLKRRNVVLSKMLDTGKITQAEYNSAVKSPLGLKVKEIKSGCFAASYANNFCNYITHLIENDSAFGATVADRTRLLFRGGLTIKTTLDSRLQKEAEKETRKAIPADDESTLGTAIVSVEPKTGNILAMAQNKIYSPQDGSQYTEYNFNTDRATGGSGGFQGGSTMKPMTTLAWLESGKNMWDEIDASRDFYPNDYRWTASCLPRGYTHSIDAEKGGWNVNNASDGFKRKMTVEYGLYWSINTATVAEAAEIDLCKVQDIAARLKLMTPTYKNPSTGQEIQRAANPPFVLGTENVTPLATAAAFSSFANKGTRCEPRALESVTDRKGNTYKVPDVSCEKVLDENVVRNLNGTLSKIAGQRVAKNTMSDTPIAGKTGTSNGAASTWFSGYSTGIATVAWVGRNDSNKSIFGTKINGRTYEYADSATFASPLWLAYMKDVVKYYPAESFGEPDQAPSSTITPLPGSSYTPSNTGRDEGGSTTGGQTDGTSNDSTTGNNDNGNGNG
ncbi:transglycosylase domain-containing protein [Neomicrococcus lactis]|uniref:transglycosylase domain-containing protein n=1 Tax=Neomicrococcus lactis TaxID=732241 RepID=UPI0023016F39|nr:transglycosylase domain-containing protein [Neomicrococcus lactis]